MDSGHDTTTTTSTAIFENACENATVEQQRTEKVRLTETRSKKIIGNPFKFSRIKMRVGDYIYVSSRNSES